MPHISAFFNCGDSSCHYSRTRSLLRAGAQFGGRAQGGFTLFFRNVRGRIGACGRAATCLSALLATSALAFGVVKYAGAAYLNYLGVRMIGTRKVAMPIGAEKRAAGSCSPGHLDGAAQSENGSVLSGVRSAVCCAGQGICVWTVRPFGRVVCRAEYFSRFDCCDVCRHN